MATATQKKTREKEEYIIYIDNGGTFTDAFVLKPDGTFITGKSPTTPKDLSIGLFNCVEDACQKMGKTTKEVLSRTVIFGYGTTQGTNIVVTGTGASRLGFITTRGHEDRTLVTRLRPAGLPRTEAMHIPRAFKPEPLIPRKMIKGVIERIDCKGNVVIPLREDEVRQVVKELLDDKIEGIAIGLMWSFLNPDHERRIAEIIEEMSPGLPVSMSSVVAPIIREYPRFMSTIIDLYIGKALKELLLRIGAKLADHGYRYPLLVMQASGGLARREIVKPVTTLHSGPVGGLAGVEFMKKLYGFDNMAGCDPGGTSFDVCVLPKGRIEYLREPIVGRFEICNPMRDIVTIGAGGGTKARVEKAASLLIVGPESAGSDPGPVCYDRGGEVPTVTDADIIMNRINADYFLGGKMKINKDKAYRYIKERIADPLGIDVMKAAEGICKIIDANMGSMLRSSIVVKGGVPSEYGLMVYGSAGPTHCAGFTAGLDFKEIIIPSFAGEFCAFGAASSDIMHRYEASPFVIVTGIPFDLTSLRFGFDECKSLDDLRHDGIDRFNKMFAELHKRAEKDMLAEGISKDKIKYKYEIQGRYGGQLWELRAEVPVNHIYNLEDFKAIVKAFEERYFDEYGLRAMAPRGGLQIITIAVEPSASLPKPVFRAEKEVGENPDQALKGQRDVWFDGGWKKSKIYAMEKLLPGNLVLGPAIIEGADTTLVVPMDRKVIMDKYRMMLLRYR